MEYLKSELENLQISKKKKIQTLQHHNLTLENIIEIENLENFSKMLKSLKKEKIIGIDCEWYYKKNVVDLMQIGTKKKIYLIKLNILFTKKKKKVDNL